MSFRLVQDVNVAALDREPAASAELADCALTCEPTNVIATPLVIFALCVAKAVERSSS
jgi:hypothetical protein